MDWIKFEVKPTLPEVVGDCTRQRNGQWSIGWNWIKQFSLFKEVTFRLERFDSNFRLAVNNVLTVYCWTIKNYSSIFRMENHEQQIAPRWVRSSNWSLKWSSRSHWKLWKILNNFFVEISVKSLNVITNPFRSIFRILPIC